MKSTIDKIYCTFHGVIENFVAKLEPRISSDQNKVQRKIIGPTQLHLKILTTFIRFAGVLPRRHSSAMSWTVCRRSGSVCRWTRLGLQEYTASQWTGGRCVQITSQR